jgi:hypothetical protein
MALSLVIPFPSLVDAARWYTSTPGRRCPESPVSSLDDDDEESS